MIPFAEQSLGELAICLYASPSHYQGSVRIDDRSHLCGTVIATYDRLHVPTGTVHSSAFAIDGCRAAHDLVAHWDASMPSTYRYRLLGTQTYPYPSSSWRTNASLPRSRT